MSEVSLDVLAERTRNIGERLEEHMASDEKNFKEVFVQAKGIEIQQAKNGVVMTIIVVASQAIFCALLGAWIKGWI